MTFSACYIAGVEIKKRETEMKDSEKTREYIQIVTEREPERTHYQWMPGNGLCDLQRIPLMKGISEKPAFFQEEEILSLCREHYSDNTGSLGNQYGRILSYRYHFAKDGFLEYRVEDLYRPVTA
jgi:hypothetical protein